MKILWPHNFSPKIDEAGIFMKILADELRRQGIKNDLLYLGDLRKPDHIIKALLKLRKVHKEYDLIHAQYGSMCGFITALACNNRKVLTLRGSDWHFIGWGHGKFSLHSFLATNLTKMVLRKYDAIIPVSKKIKREVDQYNPKSNIYVLPSGVDMNKFVPREKKLARSLLGLDHVNDYWILFASVNLRNPIKRHRLAEASVRRANKLSSRRIIIRVANNIPHDKMPLFVSACDLVLCTSIYEGWPNIIKEGLACNIPFVSTDISDLREIAEIEESCVVCSADADTIAENIVRVLSYGRSRDLRKYILDMDLKVIGQKLITIYDNILTP